ncbi:MAG TPA: PAS domain S-box protein [Bacteroidota bacterium]|nr:PAS domain S-box protein [Bacteroidota bacterium]
MKAINSRTIPWMYIAVFVFASASVSLIGLLYYREQSESIKQEKKKELATIVDLKVQQIEEWRKERAADALTISRNRIISRAFDQWLKSPSPRPVNEGLASWLTTRIESQPYDMASLLDTAGNVLLSAGRKSAEIGFNAHRDLSSAFRTRNIVFGDFEKEAPDVSIYLDIIAPLLIERGKDTVSVGAVLLQLKPLDFFFPSLNSFPSNYKTCETLLFRKERDSVSFINETKDHKHAPLSLCFPLTQSQLPAVEFINTGREVVEGIDYNGIPVLAAARNIPGTPWGIVIEESTDEVYAPIRELKSAMELNAGLFIATVGSIIGLFWRQGRLTYYKRELALELERKALAEHYDYATRYANDIIIMADEAGNIIDINERGIHAYGYSRNEMRRLTIADIREMSNMTPVADAPEKLGDEKGLLFETRHRRKDGAMFPVEVSARTMKIGDRIFFQSIVRDITERKQAEQKLRTLNSLYYMLSQVNQTIVRATEQYALFQKVCDISVEYGSFQMAWIGMFDTDSHRLKLVCQRGLDDEFFSLINEEIRRMPPDHQIVKALQAGQSYICNDIEKDVQQWPWRRQASVRRYRSFALLPIQLHSRTVGLFALNASSVDFFSQDELELLNEIVLDVSFAIENIERELERALAEEALKESTELVRNSQKAGRIGSYATDFTAGVWRSSEELDDIFGIDQNFQRTVEGWGSIVHPDEQAGMISYLDSIIAQRMPFDKEYRIIRVNDGAERWVYGRGELIFGEDGRLLKMIGTIQDITDRKKSEELIALHSRALESAANAIVITNREGIIVSVNPAFSRFTGYAADEVVGKNPRFLSSGAQAPSFYKSLWETILSGRVWQGEIVNKRKDGSLYNEEMTITPVANAAGNISFFIAIKQDVTERKRLQAELVQMQKMESIGTLASGIAHDFNNILGIIVGYAALIERDPRTISQSIQSINAAVNRGAGLVKQILTFARKSGVVVGPLEVNSMIKEIAKMLKETFPKTVEISLSLGRTIPPINADPTQLHQAVLNLCVNARDAMPNGGVLTLQTDVVTKENLRTLFPDVAAAEYARLSVIDTGAGMDNKTLNQIFDPFFTTKAEGKGTGLGLSVVYGVMKEHHGFVNVESTPGKGSTFNLYFPVIRAGANPSPAAAGEEEKIPGGSETLLIVEDEVTLLEMMKVLVEDRGYRVIAAMNGLEALDIYRARGNEIDLVVSDIGLPKMNGRQLFKELKNINPSIKVIIASGYIDADEKSEIFKGGVEEFIQKPYLPDEVLKKIRSVLDKQ